MLRFLAAVGAAFLTFLATTGRLALFAGMSLATAFTPPFYPGVILYLTLWLPRRVRTSFTAWFIFAIPLANIFGGPLSTLILQHGNVGAMRDWQVRSMLGVPMIAGGEVQGLLFLDDLELPDLAKRNLAEVESEGIRRAGYSTSGSPTNISVSRTVSRAMARRVALRRPRPEELAALEAELADCDEASRAEICARIEAIKTKMRRIPFIDPIDIRYRRFETLPKPIAQAVMFCLMDVSGSMTEHMKDLAKRFYVLLYVFLKRRYRHVEIVFIRHTDRAEEVDEDTFFHSPASGGTLVSSALEAMRDIVRSRFRPADWNIYAAQASDGDNSFSDGEVAGRLLTEKILPASQFFAYLEVGQDGGMTFDMPDSALWTLYERLRTDGAPLSMRKVCQRSEIFPVFHDLFQRRGPQERASR